MNSVNLLSELDDLLCAWWMIELRDERYLPLLEALKGATADTQLKNKIWMYSALLDSHLLNLNIFGLLKSGSFYQAWCALEQLEILLSRIDENKACLDGNFGQRFLSNAVGSWQALFPYKIFFSSREIIKKLSCSICEKPRSVLQGCGHRKGKLYAGEICYDVAEDFELITWDVVSNPVRKSSVPFSSEGDQHNYTMLKAVLQVVTSPRHQFRAYITGTPLKKHTGVHSPSSVCPCMRSIRHYDDCCMPRPTIETNHINLVFHLPMQACVSDLQVVTESAETCPSSQES
ncbi:hypothetical protein SFA35_12750 [Pseudomonas sp. HR96]|uniref:hypothetical protein n=1 Tax=Pseudomonas sp. HR96 TaxID=1027966 RepID=UPI002A74E5E7|nr:hypothetical protein [Pseudomonas sp. HR96]WPO97545.1 hypothetical protein SFA35_12750 [Pseudomonas sp. HR96]